MSIKTDLQRMEFINSLQRFYTGIIARNELQGTELISVIFEDSYDLDNETDIGALLSALDYKIEQELKPELYDYLTNGIEGLVEMGVNHTVANTVGVMGDMAYDFMDINDRLALDYISRVGQDGLRLSDRIWKQDTVREAITQEVFKSIQEGDSKYELARKIEEVVAKGTPKHAIARVAESELTYAYSHAKADVAIAEAEILPNAVAYTKISLSPAHPKLDICDYMVGTYRTEDAPLPPFHPHCLCNEYSFVALKKNAPQTTTLENSISRYKSKEDTVLPSVETYNKVVEI